jgi:hypothetical protein
MANKYWNGTGTWATLAYWFLDDAHTISATEIPISGTTDNVFFTINSSGTCTISATSYCYNLDMTGFVGTLAGSGTLIITGSMKFSGGTFSYTGNLDIAGTTGSYEIWTNGLTLNSTVVLKGNNLNTGADYILMDDFKLGTSKSLSMNVGGLNCNGKTITAPSGFRSGNNSIRRINISGCTFYVGSSSLAWQMRAENLSLTGGSETIYFVGSGSVNGITGGGFTYNKVHFIGSNTVINFNNNDIFNELKIIPTTTSQIYLYMLANITINNTFVIEGPSNINRIWFQTNLLGVKQSITNNGTLSMRDVDFHDIIGTGTTSWVGGTRIGDGGGNTGITFDTSRTLYWVATSGGSWSSNTSWSLTSGGTSGEYSPLPQDDVTFTSNSITSNSRTITVDCHVYGKNINFLNLLYNPTITLAYGFNPRLYGDITLGSNQTHVSNASIYWLANQNVYFTTNNESFPYGISMYFRNCSLELVDDINIGSFRLICGILNTNNKNITCFSFAATNETGTSLSGFTCNLGSSTVYINGNNAVLDFNYSNFILNAGTSLIKIITGSGAPARDVTIIGGGKTFYNLWISAIFSTLTYYWIISGNNTFNNLNLTPASSTRSMWVKFTSGSVQRVNTFTALGYSTAPVKIIGSTSATWTLSGMTTTKNCCDYLDISGSTATPSNIFYAGTNSINSGGNTGWTFSSCTLIKAVSQVLYASSVSKVLGIPQASISKITGLS